MVTEFSDLYGRYAADVHRFAVYLTGDPALAEDLVSETFLRVWTSKQDVRTSTVKAYLFTIVRNLYLKTLRRPLVEPVNEAMHDPAPAPDEQLAQRTELDAVLAELQRLPENDRAALLMRALDEMPYEEIAAALGLSVNNVKVRVFRARMKLSRLRDLPKEKSHALESNHA